LGIKKATGQSGLIGALDVRFLLHVIENKILAMAFPSFESTLIRTKFTSTKRNLRLRHVELLFTAIAYQRHSGLP
jgi:hypothetical protein